MTITADDYTAVRKGEKSAQEVEEEQKARADQERVDAIETKEFLVGVTKQTINVSIASSDGGVKDVAIRARLPKREARQYRPIFDKIRRSLLAEEDVDFYDPETTDLLARFLADVTVDPALDYDFWAAEEYEEEVATEILLAYVTEPIKRRKVIQKFRNQ